MAPSVQGQGQPPGPCSLGKDCKAPHLGIFFRYKCVRCGEPLHPEFCSEQVLDSNGDYDGKIKCPKGLGCTAQKPAANTNSSSTKAQKSLTSAWDKAAMLSARTKETKDNNTTKSATIQSPMKTKVTPPEASSLTTPDKKAATAKCAKVPTIMIAGKIYEDAVIPANDVDEKACFVTTAHPSVKDKVIPAFSMAGRKRTNPWWMCFSCVDPKCNDESLKKSDAGSGNYCNICGMHTALGSSSSPTNLQRHVLWCMNKPSIRTLCFPVANL